MTELNEWILKCLIRNKKTAGGGFFFFKFFSKNTKLIRDVWLWEASQSEK